MLWQEGIQYLMLGKFGLYYNGEPVVLKKKYSAKPVQLLMLLLNNREQGVSRRTLVESLFGEDPDLDVTNTLNATISQLRRLLRESILPEENYIRLRFDRYFFYTTELVYGDVELVTKLRQQADMMTGSDKLGAMYQLCSLYNGRFLPELDGTEWVEVARAHYHRLFHDSMTEICNILKERGDYAEIYRLTEQASKIFPFDEWQVWQQKSLLEQGRLTDAKLLYQEVEKLYLAELDVLPPKIMRERLHDTDGDSWRTPQRIGEVCQWLQGLEYPGPQQVPFAAVGEVYNLFRRNLPDRVISVLLCTLTDTNKRSQTNQEQMPRLEKVLQQCLCREDVFARYTRCQFLILRLGSNAAADEAMAKQIRQAFQAENGTSQLTIHCQKL